MGFGDKCLRGISRAGALVTLASLARGAYEINERVGDYFDPSTSQGAVLRSMKGGLGELGEWIYDATPETLGATALTAGIIFGYKGLNKIIERIR